MKNFSIKFEKFFLVGSNGGFSWNLNLSAVWDEDLGYLCFEHVRLDFSTHDEVPLHTGEVTAGNKPPKYHKIVILMVFKTTYMLPNAADF